MSTACAGAERGGGERLEGRGWSPQPGAKGAPGAGLATSSAQRARALALRDAATAGHLAYIGARGVVSKGKPC